MPKKAKSATVCSWIVAESEVPTVISEYMCEATMEMTTKAITLGIPTASAPSEREMSHSGPPVTASRPSQTESPSTPR